MLTKSDLLAKINRDLARVAPKIWVRLEEGGVAQYHQRRWSLECRRIGKVDFCLSILRSNFREDIIS